MKKTIVIMIMVLLAGCSTMQYTDQPGFNSFYSIDFREYSDKGFLFTTETYVNEYTTRGILEVSAYPKINYRNNFYPMGQGYLVKYFVSPSGQRMTQMAEDININSVVAEMYKIAVEMGGDAVINFKTEWRSSRTDNEQVTEYKYLTISGLVIKRAR